MSVAPREGLDYLASSEVIKRETALLSDIQTTLVRKEKLAGGSTT